MKFRFFWIRYSKIPDGIQVHVFFVKMGKQTWSKIGILDFQDGDVFDLFKAATEDPMHEFIYTERSIDPLCQTQHN